MSHVGTESSPVNTASTSTWIAFEPAESKSRTSQGYGRNSNVKRKQVRAAAAVSSTPTRLATLRRRRTDDPSSELPVWRSAATTEREQCFQRNHGSKLTCITNSTSKHIDGQQSVRDTPLDTNDNQSGPSLCGDVPRLYRCVDYPRRASVIVSDRSSQARMLGVAEHGVHIRTTPLFLRGIALLCMHMTSEDILRPCAERGSAGIHTAPHDARSSFAICLSALAGWEKVCIGVII